MNNDINHDILIAFDDEDVKDLMETIEKLKADKKRLQRDRRYYNNKANDNSKYAQKWRDRSNLKDSEIKKLTSNNESLRKSVELWKKKYMDLKKEIDNKNSSKNIEFEVNSINFNSIDTIKPGLKYILNYDHLGYVVVKASSKYIIVYHTCDSNTQVYKVNKMLNNDVIRMRIIDNCKCVKYDKACSIYGKLDSEGK